VLSPETCDLVLKAMVATIQSDAGTGHKLRIPGYTLGGKTGTAQKINKKSGTVEGGGYVSNFVGYVPGDDPKAVVLVMIDNPKRAYYGATVAGPVFVDVAKAVIRRLGIPREGQLPKAEPGQPPAQKADTKERVEAKVASPSSRPINAAPKGPNIQVNARKIPKADSPPPKSTKSESQGGR
jgi:cell division protein FtsI (penicillin-binding protein 3)